MAERGSGTIVHVTGGSARRALPGRAPWAAGAAATRALSQAAANELKPKGVHVCLLVCDGTFGGPGDDGGGERIDTNELARAVQYLHEQGRSAWTHELVVTPIGHRRPAPRPRAWPSTRRSAGRACEPRADPPSRRSRPAPPRTGSPR